MNDLELKELEKYAMALDDPELREEALKAIDKIRSLNTDPASFDMNSVQTITSVYTRERRSLLESLRLYKDLQSNDPAVKKKAAMECWAKDTKEDELVKKTREKLIDPAYSKKIRKEFQSRKLRFNAFTILNLLILFVYMVFAVKAGLPGNIIVITAFAELFGFFFYVGNRLWRCPACELKFDLNPSFGRSVSKSCPRCGAQFS